MENIKTNFTYYKEETEISNLSGFIYLIVPSGIKNKTELLKLYGLKYMAPYYNFNMDSLDEALSDTKYLPYSINNIVHKDLPDLQSLEELYSYLHLLNNKILLLTYVRELTNKLSPPYGAELRVYFPIDCKNKIQDLFKKFNGFYGDSLETLYKNNPLYKKIWSKNPIVSKEDLNNINEWRTQAGLPKLS